MLEGFAFAAILSCSLFAGAALYINAAEHPARMECGTALAATVFGPSYKRAAVMQVFLALLASLSGSVRGWLGGGTTWFIASALIFAVIPFTLIVILPAAHLWLWVPAASRVGQRGMLAVYAAGFLGPLALLAELAGPQGLGSEAPRALVAMTASGYLSPAVSACMCVAAAAAAQLGAIALGRYAAPHAPV
jgi:hypothetical protein